MQEDPHSPLHFRHLHSPKDFTPEISPLDEFINRGRLLSKQLSTSRTGSPTLTPLTVHASLRRTGRSPSPSPLARSRTVGNESLSTPFLAVSAGDNRIATPASEEERPISSYPRFSTVSTTSTEDDEHSGERDSVMSGATSVRDSNFTLMGGFLNPDRSPPNLQTLQGRKGVEFEQVGRISLKPVIVGSAESVEISEDVEVSPKSGRAAPVTEYTAYNGQQHQQQQQQQQQGRGRDRRRGPEDANAAAYARSKSQPPTSRRMPPPRQFSDTGDHRPQHLQQPHPHPHPHPHHPHPLPVRRDSNGSMYPPRQDSTHKYRPYRQDSSSSGATSIGQLSRQGSAEDEVFPPPQRQGSASGIAPLSRQGSAENGKFPGQHRQGSGADRLHPHRQDSRGPDQRMYPRSPNRQGSGQEGMKYMPYRAGPPPPLGLGPEQDYRRPSIGERRRPSRQDSHESDRGRMMNRGHGEPLYHPGPQRSPTHSPAPMILPMVAGMRAASPESMTAETMERDHELSFGPPTPSYQFELIPRPGSAASTTPSLCSIGGTPKPVFNFSRPLSNRPSIDTMHPALDIPQRLTPEQSPIFPDEYSIPTPVSLGEEHSEVENAAPTVVYSRFALPRGRMVDRNSVLFTEPPVIQLQPGPVDEPQAQHPIPTRNQADTVTSTIGRPPSPASPPTALLQPAPARDRAATYNSRSPSPSQRSLLSPGPRPNTAGATSPRSPRSPSNFNIPPVVPTATMSPDDHVAKGIALHESGSLQESTYHLRLAANGAHPTGMLLYALACRHGWGMRANPKEGVMWLKKVTELASSEVADDEMKGTKVDFFEKKGRRAQFALSIYELGVSHMNGWGTEMDKGLAVRCFEIAGRWGDPDALAETGFCYANGVGCKKDMKKSAKFYRMAEAKGMNMPGNSWIWKDKYLDDEDRAAKKTKADNEKTSKKKK